MIKYSVQREIGGYVVFNGTRIDLDSRENALKVRAILAQCLRETQGEDAPAAPVQPVSEQPTPKVPHPAGGTDYHRGRALQEVREALEYGPVSATAIADIAERHGLHVQIVRDMMTDGNQRAAPPDT